MRRNNVFTYVGERISSLIRYGLPVVLGIAASAEQAHAIGIVPLGWLYSFSDRVLASGIAPGANQVSGWGWVLDPSTNVLNGQVTFKYDPTVMTILPQFSGFIGDFSNDPSTAIPVESIDTSPLDVSNLPGPRPGMTWNLAVGTNTVTLSFDMNGNPVSINDSVQSENFFILSVETSSQVIGWQQLTSGQGQFYELGSATDRSQTYATCSSPTLGQYSCGDPSANSYGNFGYTAMMAPEPTTTALLGSGLLGLLGWRYRRRALPLGVLPARGRG